MSLFDPLAELVDQKVYIPRLKTWFWGELHKLYAAPLAPGRGLLMGCPLWGDEFINRFLHMCLPTIRAAKNLRALQKKGCRLVLFTDPSGFERLWRMGRDLEKIGIPTQIGIIPADIMDLINDKPLNKYWLLGTAHNLMIQMAARDGLAFHMLMPDHLYAEAYFPNMFRLAKEYEGIAQTSISGDIHACLPELEQWRKPDGSLEIPDRDLGDLAWRHLHKQSAANLMNGVDISKAELPDSHLLLWQGKDRLYLYCCHMNAAYLSAGVCKRSPVRLHNALDTELPAFMPERIGIPEADDGMTFIELSDDLKFSSANRVNFPQWAMRCWQTVHFSDHFMPLFEVVNAVPIKEQATFMDDDEIQKQRLTLVASLKAAKPHVLRALEEAEKARLAAEAQGPLLEHAPVAQAAD